jgi:hypothetical protein
MNNNLLTICKKERERKGKGKRTERGKKIIMKTIQTLLSPIKNIEAAASGASRRGGGERSEPPQATQTPRGNPSRNLPHRGYFSRAQRALHSVHSKISEAWNQYNFA